MNFFKSMLSDDPDTNYKSDEISIEEQQADSNPALSGDNDVNDSGGGLWRFGDLVKSITTKSELVSEEEHTDSNLTDSGDNDVSDDVTTGLWSFGDLMKNLTSRSQSDDLEVDNLKSDADNHSNRQNERAEEQLTNSFLTSSGDNDVSGRLWSFGDLVKNLTSKSESVLETYRRDLKEFGSGLKKESDLFREVANRAVKELPEVGATTMKSISLGKKASLESSASDVVDDSDVNKVHYSRFYSQLNAMQIDVRTYCNDPEDLDEYNKWKLGFVLSDRESEIENLIGVKSDNESVIAIYKKIVPNEVDDGSFWCRYFYKVYKLKQQEDTRASFVRRSLNVDDEEELSWDVDDVDDDDVETDLSKIEKKRNLNDEVKIVNSNVAAADDMEKNNDPKVSGGNVSDETDELVPKPDENHDHSGSAGKDVCIDKVESVLKIDENHDHSENAGKDMSNEKVEWDEISKYVKSSLQEEEDIEWDEIGDIGENDEKNVLQSEILKKSEMIKRLNNTGEDDDEDLSWDIEDDDEPVNAGSSK